MNKLTEIISKHNYILKETESLIKSVKDANGIYTALKIMEDVYVDNNDGRRPFKPYVIQNFIEDLTTAYNRLKKGE